MKILEEKCWFCGASNVLRLQYWDSGNNKIYMCDEHAAVVKSALKLRELGEVKLAEELSQEVGIETNPEFTSWKVCQSPDNNRMNVSLKGRGEFSCQNSCSVAAPLQTTLF